jgi:hypothetical protein
MVNTLEDSYDCICGALKGEVCKNITDPNIKHGRAPAPATYHLRRGDRVQNPIAFGSTAFTVIATNKVRGQIKVVSKNKGGWFSAPYHWRVESNVTGEALSTFLLPEEDIEEEPETQAPPAAGPIAIGSRALVQVMVTVRDVDSDSPESRYRCEFPDGSFYWMAEDAVKPIPDMLGQPTPAEDEAYTMGVEEGHNRTIAAIIRLIQGEMK